MRSLAFLGLMASMTLIPVAAQAQSDSGASSAASGVALATQAMRGMRGNRGGHGIRGGNRGGTRVWRGGGQRFGYNGGGRFNRSTRFFVGGFLPSYFLAPRYYVANYPSYGLVQPRRGYRWVRYYDDAYQVDDRGYIADQHYGVSYNGNGGGSYHRNDRQSYDDRRYYDDRRSYDDRGYYDDRRRGNSGNAAAGAIVGGIVGGIAGNRIAGRGNRTEGTLIGGAIGAIAGGVIGSESGRSGRYDDRYRDDRRDRHHSNRRHRDDRHHADGRHSEQRRQYNRGPVPEYVGRGDYYPPNAPQMEYGTDYGHDYRSEERYVQHPPVQQRAPVRHAPAVQTHVGVSGPGTYAVNHSNGISQSASTTIILNSAPATTTTTTTFIEEEVEYVAPRRRARRAAARPIGQTRNCNCR